MNEDYLPLDGIYRTETEKKETAPGAWYSMVVSIFKGDEKIGEYERNYYSLYNTFHPFLFNGKHYALYSRDYTATRVMTLPDCKDFCGEEPHGWGFCPVDYFVPYCIEEGSNDMIWPFQGQHGFVAGCVWGDDGSWKIQHLDLSRLEEGIIKRTDRFGYIPLMGTLSLKDSLDLENAVCIFKEGHWGAWKPQIAIAVPHHFDLETGEHKDCYADFEFRQPSLDEIQEKLAEAATIDE